MLPSQKVVLNTGIMYAKMILTFGITLYSTRIVLNELGESDFGIFNVVAGIIALLSFLNVAMSTAVRRYLSNAIGKNNIRLLACVFHSSIKLHYILGCISIFSFEFIGIFLFNGILNIAPDRIQAAYFIFHCMTISTFFSIIAIPYTAIINSHEDIFVISIIFIFESIAKLGVAIYLQYTHIDKLIIYGGGLATIYSLTTFMQKRYCYKHYLETQIKARINKKIFKSLLQFSIWSSLSYISKIISDQGVNLLLNIFGGTIVNAAYGIATQVNAQMNYFSGSLLQAIEPQIMKSEGAGNINRMFKLSTLTCKLSFFLISFFSIPILVKTTYILNLWLKSIPEHTVVFCKIIILSALISQITIGLQSGIYAKGKIKKFQLAVGCIQILILPFSYIFLKQGLPAYTITYSFIVIEFILSLLRIYFASHFINLHIYSFMKGIIAPSIISFSITYTSVHYIASYIPNSINGLIIICFFSFSIYLILFWSIVLNKEEKQIIKNILQNITNKILYKK